MNTPTTQPEETKPEGADAAPSPAPERAAPTPPEPPPATMPEPEKPQPRVLVFDCRDVAPYVKNERREAFISGVAVGFAIVSAICIVRIHLR